MFRPMSPAESAKKKLESLLKEDSAVFDQLHVSLIWQSQASDSDEVKHYAIRHLTKSIKLTRKKVIMSAIKAINADNCEEIEKTTPDDAFTAVDSQLVALSKIISSLESCKPFFREYLSDIETQLCSGLK